METVQELRLVFSRAQIEQRIDELAKLINQEYKGQEVLAIGILRGAVYFFTALTSRLTDVKLRIDFMQVSSYGSGTESSGHLNIVSNIKEDPKGAHVLIIEDVVDSGLTISALREHFAALGPASVKVAALLDKKERRTHEVTVDYTGFELDKGFVVGYGLDYAQYYRNLPEIFEVIFAQH